MVCRSIFVTVLFRVRLGAQFSDDHDVLHQLAEAVQDEGTDPRCQRAAHDHRQTKQRFIVNHAHHAADCGDKNPPLS